MPQVKVFLVMDGALNLHIDDIDESLIRHHSAKAELALSQEPGVAKHLLVLDRRVRLGAIKFVLDKIKGHNNARPLYIRVHDLPLEKIVYVYEVLESMRINPPQPHVENTIIGYIAHHRITPREYLAVWDAFDRRRETSKVMRTLIHQMAWNLVNENYTKDEVREFRVTIRDVDDEIRKRMDELAKRPSVATMLRAKQAARDAAASN